MHLLREWGHTISDAKQNTNATLPVPGGQVAAVSIRLAGVVQVLQQAVSKPDQ
jgi:hypothetical protein